MLLYAIINGNHNQLPRTGRGEYHAKRNQARCKTKNIRHRRKRPKSIYKVVRRFTHVATGRVKYSGSDYENRKRTVSANCNWCSRSKRGIALPLSHSTVRVGDMEMIQYQAEMTDVSNGQTNYSWVQRATFWAPNNASDAYLLRTAKKSLNTDINVRKHSESYGDDLHYRTHGNQIALLIFPKTN